jgi:preprotein translocase subunit SecG
MDNLAVTLLTVAEVVVALLLVFIVLMQRPRQEGLGASFGEGITNAAFGTQTTNVLQKATAWLGIALFVLTLILAALVARQQGTAGKPSLIGTAAQNAPKPVAPPAVPAAPAAPISLPATPAAPVAPVAPPAAPKAEATKPVVTPSAPAAPAAPASATPAAPAPAGQPK